VKYGGHVREFIGHDVRQLMRTMHTVFQSTLDYKGLSLRSSLEGNNKGNRHSVY